MKCPKCGLINPETAQHCGCGYYFPAQAGKKSSVALSANLPTGVTKQGGILIVPRGALLPPYCVKCGLPAEPGGIKKTFTKYPPWAAIAILLGVIPFLLLIDRASRKMELAIPLCVAHRKRRRNLLTLGWALLLLGFPVGIALGVAIGGPDTGLGVGILLFWPITVIAAVVVLGPMRSLPLHPVKIDEFGGRFKKAPGAFLSQIPDTGQVVPSSAHLKTDAPPVAVEHPVAPVVGLKYSAPLEDLSPGRKFLKTRPSLKTTCPQCHSVYSRDFRVCLHDGAAVNWLDRWTAGSLINAKSLFSKMEEDDSRSVTSGEYHLLANVGGEGFCLVFTALELKSGRERTLVTPNIDFWGVPEDAGVTEAFETFARSHFEWTAHLNENLLEIAGLAQDDDGRLFFVLDLEGGRRLAEVIRQEAPLPLWRACTLARQIALGLGALHAGGLIHGGAVPNHILVTGRPGAERIKVLPVGLQKHWEVWSILNGSGVESSGRVPADFRYFAPEQIMQTQPDARTDLHTIGVVLYEMLTAALPFRGAGNDYLRALMTEPPIPFAVARPELNLPRRLEALVVRLLDRDPSRRPANVQELLHEITQVEVDLRWAA